MPEPRLSLVQDAGWSGVDLTPYASPGEPSQGFDVVLVALQDSSSLSRLPVGPHYVLVPATEALEKEARAWAYERKSVVPQTLEAAVPEVLQLALQSQRSRREAEAQALRLRHMQRPLKRPLGGILGFARLVLNTQLTRTQREYVEGIFSSAEDLLSMVGPQAASSTAWSLSERPAMPGPALRVLVADDNELSQTLAVLMLEEQGYEVTVVEDGEEVLQQLRERSFDLVLMDVNMPRLDGYMTARAIREREAGTLTHLPIIAITAHGREGDAELCLAAGMDGFVAKPLNESELLDVMQQVLGWSDEQSRPVEKRLLNLETLQRRLGGSAAHVNRVIRQFLEMLPRQLEDIYQNFSRGDHEELRHALHRLKCSALAFDSPRILGPLDRLELAARKPLGLAESGAVLAQLRRELEQMKLELLDVARGLNVSTELTAASTENWPGLDRPLKLLLAEDNPINQTLVLTLLEDHGCDIDVVENGQEAVEACQKSSYDAVLMDVQMPVLDGLEALALIREREKDQDRYTPVVILTASTRDDNGAGYLAAGASHYLCKPIQEDRLVEVLDEIVTQRAPQVTPDSAEDVVDVVTLGARLNYKLERLARLSQVFDQMLPAHLESVREAVTEGHGKKLESSAGRFKTTLRSLEAQRGIRLVQKLELMGREGVLEGSEELYQTLCDESEQIKMRLEQLLAEAAILANL